MGVKSDKWIRRMGAAGMISPFEPGQVRTVEKAGKTDKIVSYGTSSYGYDLRAGIEWKVFTNTFSAGIIDPKAMPDNAFVDVTGESVIIPPNSFALGRSLEYFKIPRDVLCVILGKSTYARCGIIVNCTPLEPEWEGFITLEFSNTTPLPARVYANEGVAQCLFLGADLEMRAHAAREPYTPRDHLRFSSEFGDMREIRRELCEHSYADRPGGPGKYQGQQGVTLPKV